VKALTVRQPWASLIVLGIKTIETRSWKLPAAMVGQRIAIHAGAARPTSASAQDVGDWQVNPDGRNGFSVRHWPSARKLGVGRNLICTLYPELAADEKESRGVYHRLPLGAIVGYVTLGEDLPIVNSLGTPDDPLPRICNVTGDGRGLRLMRPLVFPSADITDQRPYGDFTPGRHGWTLLDPEPCEPIPAKGRLGFWNWDGAA